MADTNEKQNQRRALSKMAWSQAFARLFEAAGQSWPTGSNLSTREIDLAEESANKATAEYVRTGAKGARETLKHWEDLMMLVIKETKGKRGCGECGHEKVVEIVDQDGRRSCGRCRAGK